MAKEKTEILLGCFKFDDIIYITDPCYKKGTCGQKCIKNMLPGMYAAEVEIFDEGEWGERVSALRITHMDYLDEGCPDLLAYIGVDSGMCGFFNGIPYEEQCADEKEHEVFYDEAGGKTMAFPFAGIVNAYGVVSSSGYGDGEYPVYICYSDEGKIIAAKIVFIESDEM